MITYTDFAQNSHKAKRYSSLQAMFRKKWPQVRKSSSGVYLRRSRLGGFLLLGYDTQIEGALTRKASDIIDPLALAATEISSRTLDAPLVVSVEGSHLSGAIFSGSEKRTFVFPQPPKRISVNYMEFTDHVDGMRFAFLVGDRSPEGFAIKPDHHRRQLDLVATVVSRAKHGHPV